MKKLVLLTLVFGLIVALTIGCQQSVEPGKSGFPKLQEIELLMLQKKHWQRNTTKLHEMIYEKQEWIKGINRLYLDYPNLHTDKNVTDFGTFIGLLPKYTPDLQAKINGEKKPILRRNLTTFDAWFLNDYYIILQKIKIGSKNGH